MSKTLNLQLSWSVSTVKPGTTGFLMFDGMSTYRSTYDQILDISSDTSLSNKTDYAIPTVTGATFDRVNYADQVTLPYPASKYTNTAPKWTTVTVDDDYVVPPLNGFSYTGTQHDGVSFGNVAYNVQSGAAGSFTFGDLQLNTGQSAKSAMLGALRAAGVDSATVSAIGNVAAVSSALSKVQGDALAVAAAGIRGFGSNNGFSFAQYDKMVNATLIASRDNLNQTLDGLTLSSNPALDAIAHRVIESDRLIENLSSGDALPFSLSAVFGLEVNFGGVLAISGKVSANATAEIVIGGGTGDVVTATADNSIIVGSRNDETIVAGAGRAYINAGGGNDQVVLTNSSNYTYVDGGTGFTTAVLGKDFASYYLTRSYNAFYESVLNAQLDTSPSAMATATLSNVGAIRFSDGTVTLAAHNPLFDATYYDRVYGDVYRSGIVAQSHYDAFGAAEGRNPNSMFSTSGYLAANTDVKAAGANPLDHYDQFGWKEGRDPFVGFNTRLYLLQNPDVAASGMDPLIHYMQFGKFEGRQAAPAIGRSIGPNGFDAEYYLLANPDVAKAGADPYAHYQSYGRFEGRAASAYFDTAYYLRNNPDVAAAGIDPLKHYDLYGWKEGRNPSAAFDTALYLFRNADVAAAKIDPLLHYLSRGAMEGRAADPVPPVAPIGAKTTGTASAGHPGTELVHLTGGQRYTFTVADRAVTGNAAYVVSPLVTLVSPGGAAVVRAGDLPGAAGVRFGVTAPATGDFVVSIDPGTIGIGGTFDMTARLPQAGDLATIGVQGGNTSMQFATDLGPQYPGSGTNVGIYSGGMGIFDEYFKFSLSVAGQVELDLTGLSRGMSVLDATGHILATQAASTTGNPEQIVASLGAGTYYIDLAARPAGGALPAYNLKLYA